MEDDILFSAIVDVETQAAMKKFAEFHMHVSKEMDEFHKESGQMFDTKTFTAKLNEVKKVAEALYGKVSLPKLNDAELKESLKIFNEFHKALSAPVGNALDKNMVKLVSESRDFGNALKGTSLTLDTIISKLEKMASLQARLENNKGFASYTKTVADPKSSLVNQSLQAMPDEDKFTGGANSKEYQKAIENWTKEVAKLRESHNKGNSVPSGKPALGGFGIDRMTINKEFSDGLAALKEEETKILRAIEQTQQRIHDAKTIPYEVRNPPSKKDVSDKAREDKANRMAEAAEEEARLQAAREIRYKAIREEIKKYTAENEGDEELIKENERNRKRLEGSEFRSSAKYKQTRFNNELRHESFNRRADKNARQLAGYLPFGAIEPDASGDFAEFEKQAKALEEMFTKPGLMKAQKDVKEAKAGLKEDQAQQVHELVRKLNSTHKDDKNYNTTLSQTIKGLEQFLETNKQYLDPGKIRQIEKTVDQLTKRSAALESAANRPAGVSSKEILSPERVRGQKILQELKNSSLRKDSDELALELREIALKGAKAAKGSVPMYALEQQEIAKLEGEIAVLKKRIKDNLVKQKNADERQLKETDTEIISDALFTIKQRLKAKQTTPKEAAEDLKDLYDTTEGYSISKKLRRSLLKESDQLTEGTEANTKKKELDKLRDQAAKLNNDYKRRAIDEATHIQGLDSILQNKNIPSPARRNLESRRAGLEGKLNKPEKEPKSQKELLGFNFQDAFNFLAFSQLSNATKALTDGMIGAAAALEQYKRRIDIVLKNPAKSDKYFDFLLNYEKITPYELPEVMNAGVAFAAQEKTLKRVGETKESAVKLAGELGSINPTAGITEAQRALSRVIAGDPNGLEILRSQFNVTNETLSEGGVKMSASGVPLQTLTQKQRVVDAINKYVQDLTGGRGAEDQSTILQGKLSTLSSQVNKTMAKVMEPLIPALTKFTEALTKFLEIVERAPEPVRKAMGTIALAMSGLVSAATAGSLVSWGGKALGMDALFSGGAKAATGAATAGVITKAGASAATGAEAGVAQAAVAGLLPNLISIFKSLFKNTFGLLFKALGAAWGPVLTAATAGSGAVFIKVAAGTIMETFQFLIVNTIKTALSEIVIGGLSGLALAGTVLSGVGAVAGLGALGYKTYERTQDVEANKEKLRQYRQDMNSSQSESYRRAQYTGLKDDQFIQNMTWNDPRLETPEKTKENIARLDEMIEQKKNQIKRTEETFGTEHSLSKKYNQELGNLLDLRTKQNGFIKIDLEAMAEAEKRLTHEVDMGRATVADQAQLARKNFTDLDQEIKAEQKPESYYLSKEEKEKLEEAKKTRNFLRTKQAQLAKSTGGKLSDEESKQLQESITTVEDLTSLGSNNRSADMRKLVDARDEAEKKSSFLEKQAFITRQSQIIDNSLGKKDATGRTSFQDRINAAIARKSLIDPTRSDAPEAREAADNNILAARREKFLAENKRRIESVRQLRGEEKARLREISLEEKSALIQQTGYAEDYVTRKKAFAQEQAILEKELSQISKTESKDAYYAKLKEISDSKQAEQLFVDSIKGNEQQIRIIRETARRERLAIVQQTLTEIRNMEQKNIEDIADMRKNLADSTSEVYRADVESSLSGKETKKNKLEGESAIADPRARFEKQMEILKISRDIYQKESRKLLDQALRDNIRDANFQTNKLKREIKNNIYSIKLEMDKLGPGNSEEKNKKREELRESLYIQQNRLEKEPQSVQLKAAAQRRKLVTDYTNQGSELDNAETLKKKEEARTRAQETLDRQMQAFEIAKQQLEYQANKDPENQSQFQKVKNLQDQFQAEKTLLELKKKAATDDNLNPTQSKAEKDLIEKTHTLDILNLQKRYLDLYKDVTAEVEKQVELERQNRLEAINAKLGESQKKQNLEGFTMGGSYSFEDMQERDKLESEAFRLKAGFGLGKKKGQDHGGSVSKQGQDHGNKGAAFEGMFGNVKDDYLTKESDILKNTFDYADIQKQGFQYKNGEIINKNPSNFIPKMEAYVIVDLQRDGKTVQKISKPLKSNYTPKNLNVPQDGK
jgi:hypothetical protein